jgi:hypothetical protein
MIEVTIVCIFLSFFLGLVIGSMWQIGGVG